MGTPFQNPGEAIAVEPDTATVAVTDPRHPLFGRRFSLHWRSAPPAGDGHVFVRYRGTLVLRLPTAATSLAPLWPTLQTKLTLTAVSELVTLARHCEVPGPRLPPPSGPPSPPPCAPAAATTSAPSLRR